MIECPPPHHGRIDAFVLLKRIVSNAKPPARPHINVRLGETMAMCPEIDSLVRLVVELLSKLVNDRAEIRPGTCAIEVRHGKVDQTRVTVIIMRLKWERFR